MLASALTIFFQFYPPSNTMYITSKALVLL